jgi:predicted MFS family arabinose efflux permease
MREARPTEAPRATSELPSRLVATVMVGTLLNPLNSAMISVALLPAATELGVDLATATWLVSSFYLVGAVGMPLSGRLADLFGARRVMRIGFLLVLVSSALAAAAPSFGWLLLWRVLQAFSSAMGPPAGQAIFRSRLSSGRPPAQALGALSIANSITAALGPALGGIMVSLAGWPGIFWVNVPVAFAGLLMSLVWLPPDAPRSRGSSARAALAVLDVPGASLFAIGIVSVLAFFLSLATAPLWWLVVVAVIAGVLLVMRELREPQPFLDVRFLLNHRPLVNVYIEFAIVSLVFYSAFFGMPLWLQQTRQFSPALVGAVVVPISGVGALLTPLAARMISRGRLRLVLVLGAVSLVAGVALQLLFLDTSPVWLLLAVTSVIGIAYAFNNLGLQAALFLHAPAALMGTASGQFMTFRYVGATLCTALLGLVFSGNATTAALHMLALILTPVAALLIPMSVRQKL